MQSITYVGAGEVVDGDLAQHGVVLELRLAERRGVASDDDELGLAGAQALQGRLVTESDLARLHDQRQARGQGVGVLLRLFVGNVSAACMHSRATAQRPEA